MIPVEIRTEISGFDSKGRKRVVTKDNDVTIFSVNGDYFASSSKCPHKGGPLFLARILTENRIMCPSHHIIFNLKNGQVISNPIPETMGDYSKCENLKIFKVWIEKTELRITG